MGKVLTVVVPTYNMEDYLDRCLTSLITDDEHMSMLEVLVINDGSKDRSSEIAHSYEAKHPGTFKVIDKENGNYGSCVNKGMEIATGKYFRILDADDWFDTDSLLHLIDSLAIADVEMVVTNYSTYWSYTYKETSVIPNGFQCGIKYSVTSGDSSILSLIEYPLCIRMHQLTYRTSILHEHPFQMQTGISYTDTEFCYFPCKFIKTLMFLDIDLYQYDCCREGQTMSWESRKRSLEHMFKISRRLIKDYRLCMNSLPQQFSVIPLKSILFVFYTAAIAHSKKTKEIDTMLNDIDSYLSDIPELFRFTRDLVYRRVKYVRIWRKTGCYYTDFPFSAYDKIWDFLSH